MIKKKLFIIYTLLFGSVVAAMASVAVQAEISSMQMLIGQQVQIKVSAIATESAQVEFPQFKPLQYVIPGVECINMAELIPEPQTDDSYQYACVYTLTSFDDTLYYIPPFEVNVDGKKYATNKLALKVLTVDVDTVNVDKFFGPKDVQDNPFSWKDWELIFWLSILIIILSILVFYLYMRLRDNKPVIINVKVIKKLLPHQKAMKEIEQIKADKMVISENQKEYYTKLTDTLRRYIEERYGFNAMEMTSREIIERLTTANDMTAIEELRSLFTTADLVKFAKYSTMINENDMNLVNAIEFINSTKLENQPTEEVIKPQLTKEDERTMETRRTLKTVIVCGASAVFILLVYVLYELYQLFN
jgi:hypothetical protein